MCYWISILKPVARLKHLGAGPKLVYGVIATTKAEQKTNCLEASLDSIAEMSGLSRTAVSRSIQKLEKFDLIKTEFHGRLITFSFTDLDPYDMPSDKDIGLPDDAEEMAAQEDIGHEESCVICHGIVRLHNVRKVCICQKCVDAIFIQAGHLTACNPPSSVHGLVEHFERVSEHVLKCLWQGFAVDHLQQMIELANRRLRGPAQDHDEQPRNPKPSEQRLTELRAMPYADYLQTEEWQATRRRMLDLAESRCAVCNAGDAILHVHHRTYEHLGSESDRDLIVLCAVCHKLYHTKDKLPQPPEAAADESDPSPLGGRTISCQT